MAITVIQAPATFASLHAPIWVVASSTNVAQPDFRFVFDVYVGGLLIVRLKTFPDASGYGVVDVSRVLRSFITNYFGGAGSSPNAPLAFQSNAIQRTFDIAYGEEYASAGVVTTYAHLTVGSYAAYNSYALDAPGPYSAQQLIAYQSLWLTTRSLEPIWIPRGRPAFLSYFNMPQEATHLIEIEEIDENNQPNNLLTFTSSPFDPTLLKLAVFNLNPDFINSSGLFTGDPVNATQVGYRMRLNIIYDEYTPWVYVRFLCEPKTPATGLHFMNRLGGFDSFFFTGPTRREAELERKTYRTQPVGAEVGGNNVYRDTAIDYSTKHTWRRKLASGWLTDAEHYWLAELVASPQVLIDIDGYFYPVRILTARWSERLTAYDKMYNLEIEIEMGRQVFSQSR